MRRCTLFLALLFALPVFADQELSRIIDKDGFTYVRTGPAKDFSITDTIRADEFFYSEASDSLWWHVFVMDWRKGVQVKGYMHRSRIQQLTTLTDKETGNVFRGVFNEHKKQAEAFTKVFETHDSVNYQTTRRRLETYHETHYAPVLGSFGAYFNRTKDSTLLTLLFDVMWADQGSADELPADMLANCFVRQTDLVMRRLKAVKDLDQRLYLIDAIDFGLENLFFYEEKVPEEEARKKQLLDVLYTLK